MKYSFLALFTIMVSFQACQNEIKKKISPNIVYILADDMGYGDISYLNRNSKIKTPHLDEMAQNGIHFTDAHSGSAVCTPTRYGILTGRYAWRSSLKNGVTWSWSEPLISRERTTVASLLKKKGYHTACIGKWHLGLGWSKDSSGIVDIRKPITEGPNDNGFDYFFGITASLDIPPYIYVENDRSTTQQIDTIEADDVQGMAFWRKGAIGADFKMEEVLPVLTQKAVSYINDRSSQEKPFFLYFPLPAPHTPILPTREFKGKSGTNPYGDFVLMVDNVVGQVVEAIKNKGLEENTLIIFTSDNGCSPRADFATLADLGHYPSHLYRGHKADIYEGGHRIPFIAQWKNTIKAGIHSKETICLTDMLATCAAITQQPLAANEGEDSYNILPLLTTKTPTDYQREATVHHSINGSFAIRQGKWKLIFCPGSGGWSQPTPQKAKQLQLPPLQLYDLDLDIKEQKNVADKYPEKVKELRSLMEKIIREGRSTSGEIQPNDEPVELFPTK